MADDLKALVDEPVSLAIAGQTLQIRAYRFGQLPRVLKLLGPALGGLMERGEIDIGAMLEANGESVVELCALATGKPRIWFDQLDADDGLRIAAAIAEVNADFFERRLRPQIESLWPRMKSRFQPQSDPSEQDPPGDGAPPASS